jgi:hypothetical protein
MSGNVDDIRPQAGHGAMAKDQHQNHSERKCVLVERIRQVLITCGKNPSVAHAAATNPIIIVLINEPVCVVGIPGLGEFRAPRFVAAANVAVAQRQVIVDGGVRDLASGPADRGGALFLSEPAPIWWRIGSLA